jgi:hypothetical protein
VDEIMSRGVQLPDLFEALSAEEAHREFQHELERCARSVGDCSKNASLWPESAGAHPRGRAIRRPKKNTTGLGYQCQKKKSRWK